MRVETQGIPEVVLDRYWDYIAECICRSSPRDTFTIRMYDEPELDRTAFEESVGKSGVMPGSVQVFSVVFELREWRQGSAQWLVVRPHSDKDVRILQYLAGEREDAL